MTTESVTTQLAAAPPHAPLRGRALVLARSVWVVIAGMTLLLVIAGIPIRYERVKTADRFIRDPEFRNLIEAGVDPEAAATSDLAVGLTLFVSLFGAGLFLYWRAATFLPAVIVSIALMLWGASFSGMTSVHRTPGPPFSQSAAGVAATIQFFLQSAVVLTAMFWLPDGRFIVRWGRAATALFVAIFAALYFLVSFPRAHDLVNLVGLPATAAGVLAQARFYRRADAIRRQQIKWVVIGVMAGATGFVVWQSASLVFVGRPGLAPRLMLVAARLFMSACQIAVPVCFAVAILRYRLWQADLVIRRSIVYGLLTGVLVLIFVSGGFVLQRLLGEANTTLSFAISIVSVGLLFTPTRRGVQRIVDRNLYGFRFEVNELDRAQHVGAISNSGALTGRMLGQYRLRGVLGKGAMGDVYLAEGDERLAAVKVLPQQLARDTDFRKRFERESTTLAAITHPNIVNVHESGESDGLYYIALDYIEGRELGDIIRERGRLPFDEVWSLVQNLAAALDYAHDRGLVHRDIKPSNIMVRRRPDGSHEAVLLDFGVAKIMDARTLATSTGAIGTISYMAPEQILAAKTVDHRADIYALGVTVYEMVTGELPFTGNPAQVLFAHLQRPPTDPAQLVPDLPGNVSRSVMRALEKNPEDRFQSVGEFAAALSRP